MKRSKPTRPKLFYDGAHDGVVSPKDSISDSMIPLEPRFMFDAAGIATGAEVAAEALALEQAEQAIDKPPEPPIPPAVVESTEKLFEALKLIDAPDNDTTEIIFIDSNVEDYETLLEGLDSNAEVIFIDAESDGVEQIAEVLATRDNVDAIHIIAHGDAGELRLGNTTLTQSSMLGEHADELSVIKQALSDDADILIYGCNFAEGDFGKAAAESLGIATGADVAASEDLTGNEDLGGDWDLEYEFGDVGTVTISAEAYEGILAVQVLNFIESTEEVGNANTDGEVGEVFRFHNVDDSGLIAGPGTIDAIITITDLSYIDSITGLAIGTDTPILEDWDRAGSGALDPVLDARTITGGAVQDSEISATFTIEYVTAGALLDGSGNLIDELDRIKVDSFVSPIDIDSSANLRESVSVTAPVVSVIQNDPTYFTTELSHANGLTTISLEQEILGRGNAGVTDTDEFAATFEVQQAEIFTVKISSIIEGPTAQTGERLFSLVFDETTFLSPNTLSVALVDLDADDSSGATDLDYNVGGVYRLGDAAVSIADTDISIIDSDSNATTLVSSTITIANVQAGDQLNVDAVTLLNDYGITASGDGTDTIVLSGVATIAEYEAAIQSITFENTNGTSIDGTSRNIEVIVNNGDVDSPPATAVIDVFGTPAVDSLVTINTQPTITGSWDSSNATDLEVTVNGITYTLADAELTNVGDTWSLDLSGVQTLPANPVPYNVQVTSSNATDSFSDTTTDEVRILDAPEWSITGSTNVVEGNNATYTISLIGTEALDPGTIPPTDTSSVVLNISYGPTLAADSSDHADFDAAMNLAVVGTDYLYDTVTNTLTYTSPSLGETAPDLVINLQAIVNNDGANEGSDEDYAINLATPTDSNVSATEDSQQTFITDTDDAPTIAITTVNNYTVVGLDEFEEGDAAVDLFDGVTVDPIEPTQTIEELVFTVTNVVDGSNEVLNIDGKAIQLTDGNSGSTDNYTFTVSVDGSNNATITLTTTGAAAGDIETLIDNVTYINTDAENPTAGNRVINIDSITDSGTTGGGSANTTTGFTFNATVEVEAINDAPVVTAPATSLDATGGSVTAEGTGFSVTDIDVGSTDTMDLTLSITNPDGGAFITVVEGNTGVIVTGGTNDTANVTITGTRSQIDSLLTGLGTGTITYTADGAPMANDTLTVTVNDRGSTGTDPGLSGTGTTEQGSNSITIVTGGATNTAPTINNLNGDIFLYNEGDGAVVIDQGTVSTITDPDSFPLDGGQLTITPTTNYNASEDVYSIQSSGGPAGINVLPSDVVQYNGTDIGNFNTGLGGQIYITLNANATQAAVDALIQAITYENTNTDDPDTAARTVSFQITDGDGGTSATVNAFITIMADNDAPTVTLDDSGGTGNFQNTFISSPGTPVNIADSADAIVADVDAGGDGVILEIAVSGLLDTGPGEEVLIFENTSLDLNQAGPITFDETVNGVDIRVSYVAGVITITDQSDTSLGLVEATDVLKDITYDNTAGSPDASGDRTFTVTAIDDGTPAATSTPVVSTISIASAPAVGLDGVVGTGFNPTFEEDVSGAVNIADDDSVVIDGNPGDLVTLTIDTDLATVFNGTDEKLIFVGDDTEFTLDGTNQAFGNISVGGVTVDVVYDGTTGILWC